MEHHNNCVHCNLGLLRHLFQLISFIRKKRAGCWLAERQMQKEMRFSKSASQRANHSIYNCSPFYQSVHLSLPLTHTSPPPTLLTMSLSLSSGGF